MSSSWSRQTPWLVCAALLAACSSDPPANTGTDVPVVEDTGAESDTGTTPNDTGTTPTDTGTQPTDTGTQPTDTGVTEDAGTKTDTGTQPTDTGVTEDVGTDVGTPCLTGQIECGGACVDPMTSAANCGMCGMACGAAQSCVAGACACPTGQTACGGACVDVQSDGMNCGACGTACSAGQTCVAGACVTECAAPNVRCGSGATATCVDTQTSAANCGSCGTACAAGQVCNAGSCGCAGGQLSCSGACVDGQTSNTNCGDCGNACVGGSTCTAGRCACPGAQQLCGSGASATCIDTQTSATNCGACGNACAAGQTCVAGTCACPSGQVACGTGASATCVDTQSSAANCGACGNACPAGQTCVAGACACPSGQSLCGGACVNTGTSNANCGSCGSACGAAQTCAGGACTCPSGQTACGTACVDARTDNANCGACGNACAGGQTCQAGVCACPAGQTSCSGACVDTRSSNANCGTCGNACPAAQTCQAGACNCPAGLTFCGGACVDARTSNTNCGMCGRVCPGTAPCTAGVCTAGPPPNDNRVGAITLDTSAPSATVVVNTSAANNSTTGTCGCTSGNGMGTGGGHDVFYRFTLSVPEIVYADTTSAAGIDPSLFFQDSNGVNITNANLPSGGTCNDDNGLTGCTFANNRDAQIVALLPAGTYYLVLSGCGAGGESSIRFQHLPASNVVARLPVTAGSTFTTANTLAGASAITGACCSTGPEVSYYAVTCPNAAATPISAVGNGRGVTNLTLDQRSAGRTPNAVCAANAACGANTTVSSTLPAGAGLHVLYVDSCTAGGPFDLAVTAGACPAGTSLCSGACVTLATNPNHCGACGTVCTGGRTCTGGACVCPAGQSLCGGTCVPTAADVNNCGGCGVRCSALQTCTAGACVAAIPGLSFRIDSLSSSACAAIEHNTVTGDDRGGIAVSDTQVFYTGDSATGRFALANLAGGITVGRQYDALVTNLRTSTVYTFGTSATAPMLRGGGVATHLIEINGATGALTTNAVRLSATITMPNGTTGIFSGYDRMGVHTGSRFFHILPDGTVTDLGAMANPSHAGCENWAYWGTMEFFGGALYIDYVANATTIARTTVPSGTTATLSVFSNLSDMCSFTVQPTNNRWYFHHEGTSQFRSGDETIGYCTAAFSYPNDSFRVGSLTSTACSSVDHNAITSDDRGGIAVSTSSVFYTGDTATGRFSTADLANGVAVATTPRQLDSLTQNLRTGTVYLFGSSATTPIANPGGTATHLLEVDGNSGALLPGRTVALSRAIVMGSGTGIFSGWDRVVVLTGGRALDIAFSTGTVLDRGAMTVPTHTGCESWAFWGVAEFFGNALYVDYVQNSNTIARTLVPTGTTTAIAAFPNVGSFSGLSDMCSFTFSPQRNRWYWHHEGSSTLRGSTTCSVAETVGFCAASFTNP